MSIQGKRAEKILVAFAASLRGSGKSPGTVEGYVRDAREYLSVQGEKSPTKPSVLRWRDSLVQRGLAASTINRKIAAVNAYFRFMGMEDFRIPPVKVQRRTFREPSRELTREEYTRLLTAAEEDERLILETIACTGIRVSELRYITVETAGARRAYIHLKGKTRTILIPNGLKKKLLRHAEERGIKSGAIFRGKDAGPIDRRRVWLMMKTLAGRAGVERSKAFPHNLRHLFARIFYDKTRDVARLADVLGHANVNTTRLYLVSTGEEHLKLLESLKLLT